MSLDTFEQSLLTELRLHVAARAPGNAAARATDRRRWAVGIAGGGLTAAAVAVAISVGIGVSGPSAAYGIESQHNGDIVVTVYDLSDANGLERALAAKGVQAEITYVRGFSQADGQTRSTSGVDRAGCTIAVAKVDGGLRFTLTSIQIAGGAKLDIVTSGSSPTDVGSPVAVTWSGGLC